LDDGELSLDDFLFHVMERIKGDLVGSRSRQADAEQLGVSA
jgi:hypothetical protein